MAIPILKEPLPRGCHKIYNFVRPFLGHHYYILSLSDLCIGGKKKIFKRNNAFALYDLPGIWPHPCARTPASEVIKFVILLDPSLVIISIHLFCLKYAPE